MFVIEALNGLAVPTMFWASGAMFGLWASRVAIGADDGHSGLAISLMFLVIGVTMLWGS